jgi:hypothetical protein
MINKIIREETKKLLINDDSTYATIDIAMLVSIKARIVTDDYKILEYLQDLSDNALQLKKAIEERL